MIAEPGAPGRGLPSYQPATVKLAGTCRVPAGVRPRRTSEVRTPMAGTVSSTGMATGRAAESQGTPATGPAGTGSQAAAGVAAAWLPRESARATAPVVITARPTARVATAMRISGLLAA